MPAPRDPIERLRIQATAWAPATRAVLEHIGVGPGWACADLGCGPHGILDMTSRMVGPRGSVTGVDHDAGALLAALDGVAARRANVRLVAADATRTGLPRAAFDLVHARLVCQETGAWRLLEEMTALAKPGGFVLLEEPGFEPWRIEPPPPGFLSLAPRVAERFLPRKRSAGPSLAGLMRRHGLVEIGTRTVKLSLAGGDPYATMPLFALDGAAADLMARGLVTSSALAALRRALGRAARDPAVRHVSFPMWQVWGRRRRGSKRSGRGG